MGPVGFTALKCNTVKALRGRTYNIPLGRQVSHSWRLTGLALQFRETLQLSLKASSPF
jgi:hypothetical protein